MMGLFSERSMKLIKLYSWNSIFFKYFRKSIVYILLPLIILSLVVCFYVFRSQEEKVISEHERSFYQTSATLKSLFQDVENNHTVVTSSSDVIAYCTADENTDFKTEYDSLFHVSKLLNNICVSSQYINDIHIYRPNTNYVFSTIGGASVDKFFTQEWYDVFSKTGISDFVYYNHFDGDYYNYDSVIIVKAIFRNDHMYGIVLYDIHAQTFREIFEASGRNDSLQVLCDSDGNIFYSPDNKLIGKNINSLNSEINLENLNGSQKKGNSIYHSTEVSYPCRYICTSPINDGSNILRIAGIVVGIALVVLLFSFVLSFYLSLQFYKSIIQITTTLRNSEEDEVGSPISKEKYDELYYINSHIVSRLIKKGPDIEKKLAEQISDLKKAQFIALQTQLNPHFIYNTLNLINVMVMNMAKGDSEASRAIIILSQLLRGALDTKKVLITIGDELEYVRKYIELQKLKFNYDIDIVWDVDNDLLERKMIKFLLQPIVENAFEHGFNGITLDEYKLIISVQRIAEGVELAITNNGKKIEDEVLSSLQETLSSDAIFDQKGIGLVNVNHRIRLIYGNQYGCSIESGDEKTTIKILLPPETDTEAVF